MQLKAWEQSKVTVTLPPEFKGRGDVPLLVSAKPVGEGLLQKVVRAEVWVDDARHADFDASQIRDGALEQSLTLEHDRLPAGGMPMLIYAASQPDERAANDGKHGLFTRAMLTALGQEFKRAAAGEAAITSDSLMNYLDDTVPRLFQQLKDKQPANNAFAGQASQRRVVFRRPPREMDLFAAK